jgi:hypothetical protein
VLAWSAGILERRQSGKEQFEGLVALPFWRTVLDTHTGLLEDIKQREQLTAVSREPRGVFRDYDDQPLQRWPIQRGAAHAHVGVDQVEGQTLVKWFPDRRGMAIMGFGGGAMIGAPLADMLMNYYRTPTSVGVWQTFLTMTVVRSTTRMPASAPPLTACRS